MNIILELIQNPQAIAVIQAVNTVKFNAGMTCGYTKNVIWWNACKQIKPYRGLATRFDKLAVPWGPLSLASILLWIH